MEKIKKIILDNDLMMLSKLILIFKEVDKTDKGLKELEISLNMPYEILKNHDPYKKPEVKTDKTKPIIHEFIDLFHRMYEKLYKRKFHFTKKEIGSLNNIIKRIKEPEIWTKILTTLFHHADEFIKGVKHKKGTWNFICENITPSMVMNQLNFILNESEGSKRKKWEGLRNDK